MKKFTKLFLSCAAVAAITAAVATSAMAADYKALTATYTKPADGSTDTSTTVTIETASQDAEQTLLIIKPGKDLTSVTTDDILQIDQKTGTITSAVVPVLDETDDAGTYNVFVGGTSGDIYHGSFDIGDVGTAIVLGDVTGDNKVQAGDANAILWYSVDEEPVAGKSARAGWTIKTASGDIPAGDVTGDNKVQAGDANAALWYSVDEEPVAGKSAQAGTEVKGTWVEPAN